MTIVAEATLTTTYNGWKNKETWLANLWLTGDPESYNVLMEAVNMQAPAYEKAEWLKELLEQQLDCEVEVPCLWRDLLQTAFAEIDWLEVIKNNLD